MCDETQLPDDIEFPTPSLRPGQRADPAENGLTWLWQGYLAQQKVTALISQSRSGKATLTSTGKHLAVTLEVIDEGLPQVYVVTAFEAPPPA